MARVAEAELKIQVKVFSPKTVYYDGEAESLSAVNETGPFDILALHHNFISLLSTGTVQVNLGAGKQKSIEIANGLLYAKDNIVTIFLDV